MADHAAYGYYGLCSEMYARRVGRARCKGVWHRRYGETSSGTETRAYVNSEHNSLLVTLGTLLSGFVGSTGTVGGELK